jgi:predicted flap endonuclease-1-like 5' DNA nuclease
MRWRGSAAEPTVRLRRILGRQCVAYLLKAIGGIGPEMAARLKARDIHTTDELLEAAKSFKARKALAADLGVDEKAVLRWANLADRMRLKGVREPYAELLREAGVDTVKELKYRNPGKLAEAMAAANRKRRLVRLLPKEKRIAGWIAQAKALQTKITY